MAPRVLDLFCGAGGLAIGFRKAGFDVTGIDRLPTVREIFSRNRIGIGQIADLTSPAVHEDYDVIVGGPPCRPWSSVNLTRRLSRNPSFALMSRFFDCVADRKPDVFLMENVPPARRYADRLGCRLNRLGYSVTSVLVRYSEFGAPTSRRRLVIVGSRNGTCRAILDALLKYRRPAHTVADAIWHLRTTPFGAVQDHVYPAFETIENYMSYYETGKFGWHLLEWGRPAPSFGNVVKTYTLHPSSWRNRPPRVISIREALLLMGFPQSYLFPDGLSMALRYQMVADSVSPAFAYAVARAISNTL